MAREQARRKPKPVARCGSKGGPLHIELVAQLAAQGMGTKRFPSAMRAIGVVCSLRPDAWKTNHDRRHMSIYEVTVGNPIDSNKLENYRDLIAKLAAIGWTMTLWRVTRHGEHKEVTP